MWKRTKNVRVFYKISLRLVSFLVVLYILISAMAIFYFIKSNVKPNEYYSGYIIDSSSKKPIKGVLVIEMNSIKNDSSKTDSKGLFKLNRHENRLNDLIFSKKGYKTDTVIVSNKPKEIQSVRYLFLNDDKDTLKMMKISR